MPRAVKRLVKAQQEHLVLKGHPRGSRRHPCPSSTSALGASRAFLGGGESLVGGRCRSSLDASVPSISVNRCQDNGEAHVTLSDGLPHRIQTV